MTDVCVPKSWGDGMSSKRESGVELRESAIASGELISTLFQLSACELGKFEPQLHEEDMMIR
jgi:hypothetical protein